jgi:hypothetical protein
MGGWVMGRAMGFEKGFDKGFDKGFAMTPLLDSALDPTPTWSCGSVEPSGRMSTG